MAAESMMIDMDMVKLAYIVYGAIITLIYVSAMVLIIRTREASKEITEFYELNARKSPEKDNQ